MCKFAIVIMKTIIKDTRSYHLIQPSYFPRPDLVFFLSFFPSKFSIICLFILFIFPSLSLLSFSFQFPLNFIFSHVHLQGTFSSFQNLNASLCFAFFTEATTLLHHFLPSIQFLSSSITK